jgi:hypothetical protein
VPFAAALQTRKCPIVQQYACGARNALAANFDGVEVHGANAPSNSFLRRAQTIGPGCPRGSVEIVRGY